MPPDSALLERTLASVRANFESLRRFDPIPALMAEIPQWADWDLGGATATLANPQPWHSAWHKPQRECVGGYVTKAGSFRVARFIWTLGERSETSKLESAAAAAATAGLADMLCEGAGVPKDFWPASDNLGLFGWPVFTTTTLNGTAGQWFMAVFLAAAAKPRYSPLRLDGPLGGEVWRIDEASPVPAPVSLSPDASRDQSAVRHWGLSNFAEASLWALDLAAAGLSRSTAATCARDLGPGAEPPPSGKKPRTPRGETVCERLRALHKSDKDFAETASVRKLIARIGIRSCGTLNGSTYYQTKLKRVRAEIKARAALIRRAQKWGDFNSLGSEDRGADEGH
jgi:hypothetical protein